MQFNWQDALKNQFPAEWLRTKGKFCRVAVIDAGFDLAHPALHFLKRRGRLFHADPAVADGKKGNADVADFSADAHGTRCASILAGKTSKDAADKFEGAAAGAEVLLIKAIDAEDELTTWEHLAASLEIALAKKCDLALVAWGMVGQPRNSATKTRLEKILAEVEKSEMILLATPPNADPKNVWSTISTLESPASASAARAVFAFPAENWPARKGDISTDRGLHFGAILPKNGLVAVKNGAFENAEPSNSFAAFLVGGAVACAIGFLKKQAKDAAKNPSQTPVVFSKNAVFNMLADACPSLPEAIGRGNSTVVFRNF